MFDFKIGGLLLDDSDIANIDIPKETRSWSLESLEEKTRWLKVKQWNDITNSLSDNDLIGFGDADEITSRRNTQLLKYCPLRSKSLDIGIWFPFGRIDQAFKSDFPVSKKYKYTLGKVYLINTRRTKQVIFTSVC